MVLMMDQEDTKFKETHLPPLRLYKRQAINHRHDSNIQAWIQT